ncbi:pentatricopeptide repeat-containing protein At5g27110 [Eucalyptus grandis]|uniref:pentatricopeptide repeat-containing protein At5g27110 n=1 Tax=Eucalyptus grandis TaxID=71139 RepID=UPI00192E92E5|nr:pentatricopeptide repeat-containing protein At5g27110 [Eucalyptus grandis]
MVVRRLSALLRACTSLTRGRVIHQKIISLGLRNNPALCKDLVNFYFSCRSCHAARLVFRTAQVSSSDVSVWNCLVAAFAKSCMFSEALELFRELLADPFVEPDVYTYPNVLKACGGLGRAGYGEMIHCGLLKTGFVLDVVVASSAVSMYAKCNMFRQATRLFDEMAERDVVCWNAVISCYYQDGQAEKALEYFERMKDAGFEPNSVTLTTAISSCARLLDLERGKKIHEELVKSRFKLDGFVCSALVDMYGKCGCLEIAREIFEQIPQKNVVAWNAMITGFSLKGDSGSCIELFKRMNEGGVKASLTTLSSVLAACSRSAHLLHGRFMHGYIIRSEIEVDIFVTCSLIDFYFNCGRVTLAENVFRDMEKKNIISWNVMISGYLKVGNYFEALCMFDEMKTACVAPDAVTFTSILSVCSQLASLEKGKEIHNSVMESKYSKNEIVMGALLDMYAKCGAVDEAIQVFKQLPKRDLMSWTSMITAYGSHGQAFEALNLFAKMRQSNIEPDQVTFLAVLSACSHAGLVDQGCYYFDEMINVHRIKPGIEHYACLIDLLGRAGRLHEAYRFLQRAPEVSGNLELLSTLFSGCCLHKDLELGEEIANAVAKTNPDESFSYIMLSNLYASAKRWDKVREVRSKMKELGLKKNPGCSWIEIDQKIQSFFVGDKSLPLAEKVYDCLMLLSSQMEKDELAPS